jgi:hypothetical protein
MHHLFKDYTGRFRGVSTAETVTALVVLGAILSIITLIVSWASSTSVWQAFLAVLVGFVVLYVILMVIAGRTKIVRYVAHLCTANASMKEDAFLSALQEPIFNAMNKPEIAPGQTISGTVRLKSGFKMTPLSLTISTAKEDISEEDLEALGRAMQVELIKQFGKRRAPLFAYGWPEQAIGFEFSAPIADGVISTSRKET